jgi:hypothetical protein
MPQPFWLLEAAQKRGGSISLEPKTPDKISLDETYGVDDIIYVLYKMYNKKGRS